MEDLLAASQLGAALVKPGNVFALPSAAQVEKLRYVDGLFRFPAADANRSAGKAIWLASGCRENKVHTTVTSNRRLSGVRKVIVFVRIKRGGNHKTSLVLTSGRVEAR